MSCFVFITHNPAVAAEIVKNMIVIYQGNIIEQGPVAQILTDSQSAYNKKLYLFSVLGKQS